MTTDPDTLDRIVTLLDRAGIPYMVTGSVASSHHGLPRMTHDADVVVDLEAASLERFLDVGYIERWAEELGVLDLWRRVAVSPR